MTAAGIDRRPPYPEERECRAPSAERVFEVFASLQRPDRSAGKQRVPTFQPALEAVQEQIVTLLATRPADFTTDIDGATYGKSVKNSSNSPHLRDARTEYLTES